MAAPFLYSAWVAASAVLLPFAARSQIAKLRKAGVPTQRAHEKLGHASQPRPNGPLIWFHAASVGESLSVLALITRMGVACPTAEFLITSGTATSAQLIASRCPARTRHQFAPLDAKGPMTRFLRHWRPDAAVFVESELWPQMLRRTYAAGVPMALVNARLSERSLAAWAKRPALARYLLEVFRLIVTQNPAMAQAMVDMGADADRVSAGVNLKSMAGALPVDEDTLFEARAALGHRPVWVASSTHAGEEQSVLAAHKQVLAHFPQAHLILAPRHPERGDGIEDLIAQAGLTASRRSSGALPAGAVYLADTLGELGTWYAMCDTVFLGGSLLPIGGHNPYEVAHAGAAVLSGPHVTNFAETFAAMQGAAIARVTPDADSLATAICAAFADPETARDTAHRARAFALRQNDDLDQIANRLIIALELTA